MQQCTKQKCPLVILWLFCGTASTIWLRHWWDLSQDDRRFFSRICFGLVLPCITSWLGSLAAQKQFCNQFGRLCSLPTLVTSQARDGAGKSAKTNKCFIMIQKKCTSYCHAMKSYEQFMFCYYACCGKIETATAGTAALKPLVKRLIHRVRKLQCLERFSADETEMEPMILEVCSEVWSECRASDVYWRHACFQCNHVVLIELSGKNCCKSTFEETLLLHHPVCFCVQQAPQGTRHTDSWIFHCVSIFF